MNGKGYDISTYQYVHMEWLYDPISVFIYCGSLEEGSHKVRLSALSSFLVDEGTVAIQKGKGNL